ncbi:lytic transglycosylase domain-containing protein [Rhizobium leguminosarum]|uniref:lytic transglycosylase domain-containing protein n=1 Tax=Rhizobium leguminosarum TaxID=384 RepID=UPI0013BAC020|nr:lytic transglycosylase domain-containing protein [Rhizobium leguminosarum]NEI67723.1 transglycosylase SLT domain-containing protein [Rhizobium leguminosarum]
MIQRESNFDREAISAAGAKGLGQLMPDTVRELGVCDVLSARDNLEGAARYLTGRRSNTCPTFSTI